ncbi:hypothetical protein BDW59DRAFT_146800 [Aspergillus cavernicola]|uniref:Uncharacterized protein n=1 Tax=Aspergillus cavernicola TaxID=176166 RepID=A0ABR4IAS8_9EURO
MPFGTFQLTGDAVPQYAPPYPISDCEFSDSTILQVNYRPVQKKRPIPPSSSFTTEARALNLRVIPAPVPGSHRLCAS